MPHNVTKSKHNFLQVVFAIGIQRCLQIFANHSKNTLLSVQDHKGM